MTPIERNALKNKEKAEKNIRSRMISNILYYPNCVTRTELKGYSVTALLRNQHSGIRKVYAEKLLKMNLISQEVHDDQMWRP